MCGLDALTYAVCRNAVDSPPDCAPTRTPPPTLAALPQRGGLPPRLRADSYPHCNDRHRCHDDGRLPCTIHQTSPYFFGGATGAGLANRDASTFPLARICASSKLSRPSSHVCVNLNGSFTPLTSR